MKKSSLFLTVVFTCTVITRVGAADNPVKGEQIFQQCAACHTVGEGADNAVGPVLNHVFGRQAGSRDGFEYSAAMRAKGASDGLLWDEQSLYIFLAGPARYVPGTIMTFDGLRTEQEIKDLLAWLIQFSPAYEPGSGKIVPADIASGAELPVQQQASNDEADQVFTEQFLASADAIASGSEIWSQQCRHCHGNSAYPGKAPKLKPSMYKPEFVFKRVTNGFRKMPAWKSVFSLEQRKNVVAYVLSDSFSP